MVQVAVSADFLSAYAQVPRKVQKKVREFCKKFLEDPTQASINYERIHDMKDPKVRTVRVGIDYRAIVIHPPKGDVYTLVWVDHHDEAMAWARKKRFDVNPVLGSFQMYEIQEGTVVESGAEAVPDAESDAIAEGLLFAGQTRADLVRCGVPEPLLPAVGAIETEAELDQLLPHLPVDVGDALLMVAAGYPVDEALAEVAVSGASIDVDDLAAALERPGSRRHFRVVADEKEFDGLLDAPVEATMTYADAPARALFEDEDTGAWPLAIEVDGAAVERRIEPGETVVFGRHESCHVILSDPHISRRQLRVTNLGTRVEVERLPSKNRTVVVGRRAQDGVYYSTPEVWVRVAGTHIVLRRESS